MFTSSTQIRVHYALTDQMGVVYHSHYIQFFEIGRAEAIRALGFTYKEMEATGIMMPVVDVHAKFLRPVKYDELITVSTTLKELPIHHKVIFHSEVFNENLELCTTGEVTLYFMDAKTMKRCTMPLALQEKLKPFFVVQ